MTTKLADLFETVEKNRETEEILNKIKINLFSHFHIVMWAEIAFSEAFDLSAYSYGVCRKIEPGIREMKRMANQVRLNYIDIYVACYEDCKSREEIAKHLSESEQIELFRKTVVLWGSSRVKSKN